MILFVFFLILSLIVFLFTIFTLSRDDTVFIRKAITVDDLFNLFFLTLFVGMFFARAYYVVFNFDSVFLNPLVFILFTYYEGLSFPAGLLSGIIFLFIYSQRKKYPVLHIFDFFASALFAALPFGMLSTILIQGFSYFNHLFLPMLFLFLLALGKIFLYPNFINKELKSGTMGFISLIIISFVFLIIQIIQNVDAGKQFLLFKDAPIVMVFGASIISLIQNEYLNINTKRR